MQCMSGQPTWCFWSPGPQRCLFATLREANASGWCVSQPHGLAETTGALSPRTPHETWASPAP